MCMCILQNMSTPQGQDETATPVSMNSSDYLSGQQMQMVRE